MVPTFDHIISEIANIIALITFGLTIIRFITKGGRKRIAKMLVVLGASIEILGIIGNNFFNYILQKLFNITIPSVLFFYLASGISGACLILAGLLLTDRFWRRH